MARSERRTGIWTVVRAMFASLATALSTLGSGGSLPMARPNDDLPDKRPDYRP
jgi:hypothetical protein